MGPFWPKPSRKAVIAGIVLLAVAAVLLSAYLFFREMSDVSKMAKLIPDNVDVQVKDVVYTDVGDGGYTWELRAAMGTYVKKENMAYFDKVTVKIIQADGRTHILTGDKGRLQTETKDIDISGHVVIDSDRGDRMTMDDLHYDDQKKTLSTASVVTLEKKGLTLRGRGMTVYLPAKEVRLNTGVAATVKP